MTTTVIVGIASIVVFIGIVVAKPGKSLFE